MRIGITGAGGMLASALQRTLAERGHEVIAWTRADLDVTDRAFTRAVIAEVQPDAVVQCAAYTRVDDAETDEATALLVNTEGAACVAAACTEVGARFVYPSTDYVFAGRSSTPYRPDDPTEPISAYGCSKLAGEVAARVHGAALIVRTSWLYGSGGRNFVETITRLARERDVLEVVDDQIGRPTWTGSLAVVIATLLERDAQGVYHATDGGEPVSWYGFAREILSAQGIGTEIRPVPSDRFPRPARRPAFSVLDCSMTEGVLAAPIPDWRAGLRAHLAAEVSGG